MGLPRQSPGDRTHKNSVVILSQKLHCQIWKRNLKDELAKLIYLVTLHLYVSKNDKIIVLISSLAKPRVPCKINGEGIILFLLGFYILAHIPCMRKKHRRFCALKNHYVVGVNCMYYLSPIDSKRALFCCWSPRALLCHHHSEQSRPQLSFRRKLSKQSPATGNLPVNVQRWAR